MFFEKTAELRRQKEELEKELNVKIKILGRKVTFEGSAIEEYEAAIVLDAMSFGFSAKSALELRKEYMAFKKIHIRDFTRRKNLNDVRSRIIGKEGKTKRTLEEISNCEIIITESEVGIIGEAESMDSAIQAIISIVRGTKQSNAYRYLERINRTKKKIL